jgi:tripartite-type tricarboxylate transporter receptor subunit TctC
MLRTRTTIGVACRRRTLLAAGAVSLAAPAFAQAPRFPERPVEIVAGFAAGGGTDLNMRSFARFLEARLGGPVLMINRLGAGTEVAMASVARARPMETSAKATCWR